MTPSHDHATLFRAASPPADEDAGQTGRTADDGAEAMRQLRDPFAVQPVAEAETKDADDPAPAE